MQGLSTKYTTEGTAPAESSRSNTIVSGLDYLLLLSLLTICSLFIYTFHIEANLGLPVLLPFVIIGFAIHSVAPQKLRLPIFFLTNVAAILYLFGTISGAIVVGFGLGIIGISILKIPYRLRVTLIITVAAFLAAVLWGFIDFGTHQVAAKVLGALFMFRLILYLYELKLEKEPVSVWLRICYFFLLPNLIFFIFPVVDYKTFTRNHYSKPATLIYRKGLRWILIGLGHLMLYRLIYYYLVPAPSEVDGILTLIQYVATSYILILRLSGFFHLSVGIICLFGFDLPPTFSNYFTAAGFNTYWRRINIYWKDFLQKVLYFPIFFLFKKRNLTALAITTLVTFAFNWFLHSFQWFWIKGAFPIKSTDIIFWSFSGLLLVANLIYQRLKKPKPRATGFNIKTQLVKVFQILGVFSITAISWSLWISDGIPQWWSLMKQGFPISQQDILWLVIGTAGFFLIGVGLLYVEYHYRKPGPKQFNLNNKQVVIALLIVGGVSATGSPSVSNRIEQATNFDLSPVLETKLNKADQERLYRGYYETLMVGNDIGSNVPDLNQQKPENWDKLHTTGIVIDHNTLIQKSLKPDTSVVFKEALLVTNEHGLRDRSYSLTNPANTLRIALLGASIEMGSGVENDQTFENLLEDKINEEQLWPSFEQVEILNFAISGTHLPQHIAVAEERILPFEPDVLIYTAHPNEASRAARKYALLYMNGVADDYPRLVKIGNQARITPEMSHEEVQRLLRPYHQQLWEWGMKRIARVCRKRGMIPIWLYIPSYGETPFQEENIRYAQFLTELGFYCYDISQAYDNHPQEEVTVRPWDRHPGVNGHIILSEAIYQAFKADIDLEKRIQE